MDVDGRLLESQRARLADVLEYLSGPERAALAGVLDLVDEILAAVP